METETDKVEGLLVSAREASEEASDILASLEDEFYDYSNIDEISGLVEWEAATVRRRGDARAALRRALENMEAILRLIEEA